MEALFCRLPRGVVIVLLPSAFLLAGKVNQEGFQFGYARARKRLFVRFANFIILGFFASRLRFIDHMVCSKDVLGQAFFDMTVIGHTARRKDVLAQALLDAGHVGLNLPENGNLDPQRPFLAILAKGDPVEGNVDSHLGVDIRFNAFIWGKVEKALPAPAQGYVAGSKGIRANFIRMSASS